MRHFLYIIILLIFSFKTVRSTNDMQFFEPVTVIELFTSQGCSSCPPADRLLSNTLENAKINGKKIFALSFHVDYWNRLGWADPFSDKTYSERQRVYSSVLKGNSVYTPQMIVNGEKAFVGSDKNELEAAMSESIKIKSKVSLQALTMSLVDGKMLTINYELTGDFSDCKINFALVSKSETTQIKRGENEGRTLVNENVVRQFISKNASMEGKILFANIPSNLKNNLIVIAFVQQNSNLKIIGAAMSEVK